jgi:hypothetical protein
MEYSFLRAIKPLWEAYAENKGINPSLIDYLSEFDFLRSFYYTSMLGGYPYFWLSRKQREFIDEAEDFWKIVLKNIYGDVPEGPLYSRDEEYKKIQVYPFCDHLTEILSNKYGINRKVHPIEFWRVLRFYSSPFFVRSSVSYFVPLLIVKESKEECRFMSEKGCEYVMRKFREGLIRYQMEFLPEVIRYQEFSMSEEEFDVLEDLLLELGYKEFVPYVDDARRLFREEMNDE